VKPIKDIWQDMLEGMKETFLPPKGSIADVLATRFMDLLGEHEELPPETKTDLWQHMAGIETEEEVKERKGAWVAYIRKGLVKAGASTDSIEVYNSFVNAKWPFNTAAAMLYYFAMLIPELAGTVKILSAEGVYHAARELTPARPDPSMGWRMFFTSDIGKEKIESALKDAGWDEEYIAALEKAHRHYTEAGNALALLRRGEFTEGDFFDRLAKNGYDDQAMIDLLKLKDLIPPPPDLVRMGLREAFRDDVAARWSYDEDFPPQFGEYMEKQGYSPAWSKRYWRAHWALPSITSGFEMLHRGVIDNGELDDLLRISDIPRKWRQHLTEVAYRPLTRVDVRRMHDMGVLGEDEVKGAYRDLGYNELNAQRMLDFTILYNDKTGSSDLTEFKSATKTVILQAYKKGVISEDQAATRLMALDYDHEWIQSLLALADWQQDVAESPDYLYDYRKDTKSIVEKAYSRRVLSHAEATQTLIGIGYSATESEYILAAVDFWYSLEQSEQVLKSVGEVYIKRGITRATALDALGRFGISSEMMQQNMSAWDIERSIRSRRLTESQYRKALTSDLISVGEYTENMRGLGYTEYDIWILSAMAVGIEKAGSRPSTGPL